MENKIPPFYTQVCGLLTGERNASLGALEDYDFEAWQPPASRRESPPQRGTDTRGVFEEDSLVTFHIRIRLIDFQGGRI